MNIRSQAALVLKQVIVDGRSLSSVLPVALSKVPAREAGLLQELCYGTLRWYSRLDAILVRLLKKPLKVKDMDIHALLLIGLYQMTYSRIPAHAAVAETVAGVQSLKKGWAKGLVNAILRAYQREAEVLQEQVDEEVAACFSHPQWLVTMIKQAWPDDWQNVLRANNQRPPMVLRVNARHTNRDDYLQRLSDKGMSAQPMNHLPHGILLDEAVPVQELPDFASGYVSVQDGAAQLAAYLMDLAAGHRVLDACAAPGGKSCHMLEIQAGLEQLVALDSDSERLMRVHENLQRLGLQASVVQGDGAVPEQWWDGKPFDRILLDAPCSATGVIRRHPDIKLLRRPEDIDVLLETQGAILESMWTLLKPGGVMVYATCSILPQENEAQIAAFLTQHGDARELTINADWGRACKAGRQILPGEAEMDGFYYACLQKVKDTDEM